MNRLPRELKLIPTDPTLSFIDKAKAISFRKGYVMGLSEKSKMQKREARKWKTIHKLADKLSEIL